MPSLAKERQAGGKFFSWAFARSWCQHEDHTFEYEFVTHTCQQELPQTHVNVLAHALSALLLFVLVAWKKFD